MTDANIPKSLIFEGEELLARMNAINNKYPGVRLNLEELRQWSSEVEAWASANKITLPKPGTNLDFRIGWESPARAYITRVLTRLKKECAEFQVPFTQQPISHTTFINSTTTAHSPSVPHRFRFSISKITLFFTKTLLGIIILGIALSIIAGLIVWLFTRYR